MRKVFLKVKVLFLVFLVVFSFLSRPKTVKAEALSVGGGMYLATLAPALLPAALIGLTAILLLGWTVTNWDDITAFGQSVIIELGKMGKSVSDVVSGFSVNIDGTFKKAVEKVGKKTGSEIEPFNNNKNVYTGQIKTGLGFFKNTGGLALADLDYDSSLKGFIIGNLNKSKADGTYFIDTYSYSPDKYIHTPKVSVSVDFSPQSIQKGWEIILAGNGNNRGFIPTSKEEVLDENGNLIALKAIYDYSDRNYFRYKVYLRSKHNSDIVVKRVSIPELGIDKTFDGVVETEKLKANGIDSSKVDEYINTAFPNSETVTFDKAADVASATLVNLPAISNKTYTDNQVKVLEDIGARARPRAEVNQGVDAGSITGVSSGVLTGAGTGFLDKLWEWLQRLLDSILGIPAAILAGLQALWDWLAKIWESIKAIPGAIAEAFRGVLEWAFGIDENWLRGRVEGLRNLFNSKFPALSAINYRFVDKETFDDLYMTIPNIGPVLVVKGDIVTKYGSVLKKFMSAFFYFITGLFFFKRFYKVAED